MNPAFRDFFALKRPVLQALLELVRAGKIYIVLVFKGDRLRLIRSIQPTLHTR
jgi:DNA invertase Pin-like site-specific DNA recombinase